MSDIDTFATQLLEEAKRFLELSREKPEGEQANLHASLMLGFCGLEAHLNSVCEELAQRSTLATFEKGILLELEVERKNGEFLLTKRLKIQRIEERIEFIHAKFGTSAWKTGSWRTGLASALDLRNKLTHPKNVPAISWTLTRNALVAIIETIDALYYSAYRRKFPAARKGLDSILEF